MINSTASISLRPVVLPGDEEFLRELFFSSREDLKALPLDAEQKNTLLGIQYAAQKQHYKRAFPNAAHEIITFDKRPAGHVLVERRHAELLLIDITILPQFQNLGIGSVVLRNLLSQAAQTDCVFGLHVLKTNQSAARLYRRLGLSVAGETETHYKMERRPAENL